MFKSRQTFHGANSTGVWGIRDNVLGHIYIHKPQNVKTVETYPENMGIAWNSEK